MKSKFAFTQTCISIIFWRRYTGPRLHTYLQHLGMEQKNNILYSTPSLQGGEIKIHNISTERIAISNPFVEIRRVDSSLHSPHTQHMAHRS